MAKTPSDGSPDPMAHEVERLLAQLARSAPVPAVKEPEGPALPSTPRPRPTRPVSPEAAEALARWELVGFWSRVVLSVALAVMMTQWPYRHTCGWPLAGYGAAVGVVVLSGAWVAFASWRRHTGVAHLVALVVVYWGLLLALEIMLPRIGYAAVRAAWRCAAPGG